MYHLYGRVLHTMPKSSWKLWRTKAFLSVLISSLCSYFMVSRFALTNQNQPHILPRCSVLYVRCWRADWSDWRTYIRPHNIFFPQPSLSRMCSRFTYKYLHAHTKIFVHITNAGESGVGSPIDLEHTSTRSTQGIDYYYMKVRLLSTFDKLQSRSVRLLQVSPLFEICM